MADNTELNPGVGGDVIASDDIGGVKYQRVKLGWGGDGVYNEVDASLPYPVSSYSAPLEPLDYTSSGVIPINTDLLVIDCIRFKSLLIHCVSIGTSGVAALQWSNDPAFTNIATASLFGSDGALATSFNGAAVRVANVFARYARLRLTTATTAGNTEFAIYGSAVPYTPVTTTQSVSISALPAGTNLIGDNGTQYRANNTGAAGVSSVLSAATPTTVTVKGSAGRLIGWDLQNSSAALRSVKLFNATAPTGGTTSAAFEIDIPAGGYVSQALEGGIGFSTAITHRITSAKGLTDNTATGLAANDVSGSFYFA